MRLSYAHRPLRLWRVAALVAMAASARVEILAQPARPAAVPAATAADGAALMASIVALTAPGMDGRAAGTKGSAKAQAWITGRLSAIGVTPAGAAGYAAPFSYKNRAGAEATGTNLLARCEGRRPDAPVLVVSAHYDHLGVRNGDTYHGADDNASGVAMLLLVAERCKAAPFDRTLILAFFDAEEQGLQGAQAFLTRPPVERARLALNVNFDMVSRSDRREVYVAGPGRWPRLKAPLEAAAADAPIVVKFGHDTSGGQDDWTAQSDHGVFHAAGVPYVYFGVEDHADYHRPTDTADKIAPDFLAGVATVVLRALTALDRMSVYQ